MPAGNAGGNTTRTCQCSRDSIMALQDLAAALKLAPRSGPARRAAPLALPRCSWWPGSLVELRVLVPQNPRKSGSAAWFPTESPRTKRHSPVHGGTGAKMALLALTSLYAGSARLTILKLPAVRASTDLLKSGRSAALFLNSLRRVRAIGWDCAPHM